MIIDLPELQSINMGEYALSESSLLKMRSITYIISLKKLDLFNLQDLSSQYSGFLVIDTVILESMLKILLITLDIPNLVNVELPESFWHVLSKSVKSNDAYFVLLIDVSPKLADLIEVLDYFN